MGIPLDAVARGTHAMRRQSTAMARRSVSITKQIGSPTSFDVLRSFAEAKEHDSTPIRDGITYGFVRSASEEIERLRRLYEELLSAVIYKSPGETRHQTALRYIQQAESTRNQTQAGQS